MKHECTQTTTYIAPVGNNIIIHYNETLVTIHSIRRRESFGLANKYCHMSEYRFIDLD